MEECYFKLRNRNLESHRKICVLSNQKMEGLWHYFSCVFIESITSLTTEKQHLTNKVNYTTGESVGGSWTDKILDNKDTKAMSHLTQDSVAVEDDEWVCFFKFSLGSIGKLLYKTLWYQLYNFKNIKSAHGGVLLLVKLQAFGNLVKSNTAPWVFFMLFKLCKWHQIAQSITNSVLPAKEFSYLYLSLTP